MATLDYPTRLTLGTAHNRPGFGARALGFLRNWRDAHKTRDMLYKLSDRELDDIGLSRSNIERAVEQGWQR